MSFCFNTYRSVEPLTVSGRRSITVSGRSADCWKHAIKGLFWPSGRHQDERSKLVKGMEAGNGNAQAMQDPPATKSTAIESDR
jgi:hypothetical protein